MDDKDATRGELFPTRGELFPTRGELFPTRGELFLWLIGWAIGLPFGNLIGRFAWEAVIG